MRRIVTAVVACTLLGAGVALASWYDDYEAGLKAIKAGQWKTAVDKMSAAIAVNKSESNNARTYGAIFINYHPFYYRAVAYINLGQYQKAISDLEQTSGPGPIDRGSIDTLMAQAKQALETPAVVTETQKPVVPAATQAPPPPTIDNALRTRARTALDQAKSHLQSAQQRNATNTPAYQNAQNAYIQANSRWASAKSNDDLNQIIADADNITLMADSAVVAPVVATNTGTIVPPPIPHADKPSAAGALVLGDTSRRLRRALEDYFNGEFGDATAGFQSLTRDLPRNGWIWAFLGASQYSQYAFEGQGSYKDAAMNSFRKARTYGKWKNGLPDKYFSRRIRNAFKQIAG